MLDMIYLFLYFLISFHGVFSHGLLEPSINRLFFSPSSSLAMMFLFAGLD